MSPVPAVVVGRVAPMFLRSLAMKGFKSFADPTVLEFEPGVTVVVGPNGSGKSNVVDAVAWVLGAQGPRALRSADMAEVTITRTLFRSGESEYAINGAPCRLLDIQELLSDTGVGRQQHMIIGQGQLDSVLNARPEDRRAIIEDAAGVRKHRQRRERAERRLAATQENLERLGDLVREVRRQIRPLERQASAARTHAAVAARLAELRQYLAGVELAALLGHLRALLERCRGSARVLGERRRALAASLDAAFDVDVVSTLEAEAARLAEEMAACEAEAHALAPELEALARSEAELAEQERASEAAWGHAEEVADAEEALQVARARIEVLRRTGAQARAGLATLERRIEALGARRQELEALARRAAEDVASGERRRAELEAAAQSAATRVEATAAEAEAAERALAEADQQRHRSAARAEALGRALQELQGSGGREVLQGREGVVGALVELVAIDPGYESAFEAALGASMAAVVVEGRHAAREALARLRQHGAPGAVLAAPERPGGTPVPQLPAGVEPLRPHVRARSGPGGPLDAVLDAVLASAVAVEGWEEAVDVALERPDLVVVTTEGDRFARSGWRVRSASRLVTVAAVEEAEARAERARAEAEAAAVARRAARAAHEEARAQAHEATRALDRHLAELAAARAEGDRAASELTRLAAELDDLARTHAEVAASAAAEAAV